jgi:hypothetical protein
MSANPTQKQNWFHNDQWSGSFTGDSGKYYDPIKVGSSAQVDVTGKGYGAIFVENASNLTVTASNGVKMTGFTAGNIYDIGLDGAINGSSGVSYLLKRRQ